MYVTMGEGVKKSEKFADAIYGSLLITDQRSIIDEREGGCVDLRPNENTKRSYAEGKKTFLCCLGSFWHCRTAGWRRLGTCYQSL